MKRYLLDTGPLASLLLGRPGAEQLIRQWLINREAVTSMLVYGEVVEYLKALPNSSAIWPQCGRCYRKFRRTA